MDAENTLNALYRSVTGLLLLMHTCAEELNRPELRDALYNMIDMLHYVIEEKVGNDVR